MTKRLYDEISKICEEKNKTISRDAEIKKTG